MPPSTIRGHPAEPPDFEPVDESASDSDLEIDLDELDAIEGQDRPTNHARHPGLGLAEGGIGSRSNKRVPRIALRNLRMGVLRRGAGAGTQAVRGYGEFGRSRNASGDGDAEAFLADVGEGSFSRYSDASISGGDDAPLLRGLEEMRLRRRRSFANEGLRKMSLRLPSFISSSGEHSKNDRDDDEPCSSRCVAVGTVQPRRFPPNIVSNAKYTAWSFLPVTLYNEFSFFFNMYFLLVALSQTIPALRIGYLTSYVAPLLFVLSITLGKEAIDDIARRRRDNEANAEEYTVVQFDEPGQGPRNSRRKKKLRWVQARRGSKHSVPARDRLSDIQEEEEQIQGEGVPKTPSSYALDTSKKSRDLKVGDVLRLSRGQRVPADVVILKCLSQESANGEALVEGSCSEQPSLLDHVDQNGQLAPQAVDANVKGALSGAAEGSASGETFIRTDQLDGETDWKLRLASPLSQALATEELVRLRVTGGKPDQRVNEFVGTLELLPSRQDVVNAGGADREGNRCLANSAPLTIDHTAWANTVMASQATTLAVIVYTGPQTRLAMSTSPSRSKTGLLENEINALTKILCFLTVGLSIILVAFEGFGNRPDNVWYVKMMRFLVLFSTIIPINLRVNLDLGKTIYSWFIQRDPGIPGAVVRTSTIPEDLGRIEYLLSDKTGTLTQNEMEMKKIHVGTVSYANEAMEEVSSYVRQGFVLPLTSPESLVTPSLNSASAATAGATRTRREIGTRVRDVVLALALCHNVTPTTDQEDGRFVTSYQASSPDEIAIVRWTESVGLRLASRDRKSMALLSSECGKTAVKVRILDMFPFTSESKRMGIIVQFCKSPTGMPALEAGEIWFYQKGADAVMSSIVAANDWLDEETANMAREGLRTLVVGRKRLSYQQYQEFSTRYREATLSIAGRDAGMQAVVSRYLEHDLELLGITGVEDRLQKDVKPSLELLRNAGIKIWMLTGDKVETARCVGVSSKLVARGQLMHTISELKRNHGAQDHLDMLRNRTDACLLIDGESLAVFLTHYRLEFISVAVLLPTVVACRCLPTQKAEVARLIRDYTQKRVCCIGDGGNDVSMIQAADVGVGIVGKEGRQASLAADFSVEQFCHLVKLLVWHGRNSYKRSAKLAQFVIHRGLIIAVCQTMYSIALKFEPEGLYKDWLMVGYATVYTAMPVLSLVLDKDVDENLANLYPELYKELTSGRSLSYRSFFVWVFVSIYQGCLIQGLSQLLTEVDGPKMVAVSYTVLVLNELLMVAIEITTWHWVMVLSIVGTFLLYVGSMPFLGAYFDLKFVLTLGFLWRVAAIAAISLIPTYVAKVIRRTMKPPSYRKVQSI